MNIIGTLLISLLVIFIVALILLRNHKLTITVKKIKDFQKVKKISKENPFPTIFTTEKAKKRNHNYKTKHPECNRAFSAWTEQEDLALLKNRNKTFKQLSIIHGRSTGAIEQRLKTLR